jgi:effector-binding domain-containing protein
MPDPGITLVDVAPRRTAVIAATTAMEDFQSLWPQLLNEVYGFVRTCPEFAAAIAGTPGPHWTNVMLYRDRDRDREPNVEVGVLAPAPFAPEGRVIASELPGGRAATAIHRNSPHTIGETHDAVRAFIQAHDLTPTGVLYEVYGHPDDQTGAFDTEVFHLTT